MIRIIHLSDFHLNKKNLRDWNNYTREALLAKLNSVNHKTPISFIAFTGDLIDAGGEDLGGAKVAFETFQSEVIEPLSDELDLSKNEFLIIPGNHDIERSQDQKRIELGNIEYFNEDYHNVSEFMINAIKKDDFSGMERIRAYKEFEKELYKDIPNSELTIFGNTFKLQIGQNKVGIPCLNSSWRCYGKNDSGKLIVGEDQLVKSFKFISNCDIKVALLHHPLDWLLLSERDIITNHLTKDFNFITGACS